MIVKPITPDQVADLKESIFPPAVLEAFNELIAARCSNGEAVIHAKDVLSLLIDRTKKSRTEILEAGWMNVEEIYRKAGWKVQYVRPDYTECFDSYFTFTVP